MSKLKCAVAAPENGSENTNAAFQLHRNLLAGGLPKRKLPSADTLENLLRLGFAIRLIDEVADLEPLHSDGLDDDDERLVPAIGELHDGAPPTQPIDVEEWLSDSATVCVSEFEPFAERALEAATLDRLKLLAFVDYVLGERPRQTIGDSVVAALANARMGYALRNREIQLVGCSDDFIARDDPFASLLSERVHGLAAIPLAVTLGVLTDVLVLQLEGGRGAAYDLTPGVSAQLRRSAIQSWADQHFPGDHPHVGHQVTVDLLEYGYFLHRILEVCPGLQDW
jgi:hypothetical protein